MNVKRPSPVAAAVMAAATPAIPSLAVLPVPHIGPFTAKPPTLVYVGMMHKTYVLPDGRRIKGPKVPVYREKRYLSRNKYDGKNRYPVKP